MTQHTPGPWTTDELGTVTSEGRYIAACEHFNNPSQVVKANAEFIVRACNAHDELLDVCQRLHAAMMDGHHIAPYEYRAVLGDAIAKATQ